MTPRTAPVHQPALFDAAPAGRESGNRPRRSQRARVRTESEPGGQPSLLDAAAEENSSPRIRPLVVEPTLDKRVLTNVAALRLARALEEEERQPDSTERRLLAAFTPWGALPHVFRDPRYAEVRDELQSLLGDASQALLTGKGL